MGDQLPGQEVRFLRQRKKEKKEGGRIDGWMLNDLIDGEWMVQWVGGWMDGWLDKETNAGMGEKKQQQDITMNGAF